MPPNLQSFMHRNDIPPSGPLSPTSAQPHRLDRVAQTKGLKLGRADLPAASYSRQHASSLTNAPIYPSSSSNNSRFTNPNVRYQQNDQSRFLDSDVDSDFDATRASDLTIAPVEFETGEVFAEDLEVEAGRYHLETHPSIEAGRKDAAHRLVQVPQAQSPRDDARQGFPGIAGRFASSHHRHEPDLPVLPDLKTGRRIHDSKKRARPEEAAYPSTENAFFDGSDGISMEETSDDDDETGHSLQNLGLEEVASASKQQAEAIPENLAASQVQSQPRPLKINMQNTAGVYPPDFTEKQLKGMDYSKLSAEPWESSNEVPEFTLHPSLEGASVEKRVDHYATAKGDTAWNDQVAFFKNLSPAEWEQAGDHLLDKFNEFFQQIKQAKRDKRKILEQIEAEIDAREKKVRDKSAKIDLDFNAMQAGGESLLRGKN